MMNPLIKGITGHFDKFRACGKCHEVIVKRALGTLCEIQGEADGCRKRTSVHGTGHISHDKKPVLIIREIRQGLPLLFQHPVIAGFAVKVLFGNVIRKQGSAVNVIFAGFDIAEKL